VGLCLYDGSVCEGVRREEEEKGGEEEGKEEEEKEEGEEGREHKLADFSTHFP